MVWGGVRRRATLALGRLVCTVGCGEYYVPPRAVASVLRAPCHVMGRGTWGLWGGCRRGRGACMCPGCPHVRSCAGVAPSILAPRSGLRGMPIHTILVGCHAIKTIIPYTLVVDSTLYRREARSSDERVVLQYLVNSAADSAFVGTTRTHRATAINRTALICAQPRAPAACNSSATLSRTLHTVVCVVASLSRTRSDALRSSRLPLLSDLTRLHGRCVARRLRHGWWCFQE